MSGAEWFFLESGRQMGPVPQDQLVTLLKTRLPAGTFVWCDGMADWLKAEDVAEVAALLAPSPAPAPAPPPEAPPVAPPRSVAASPASPRTAPGPSAPRPTYRTAASASAPQGLGARPDDEPYTLNPFALLGRCFRFAGRFDRAQFAIAYFADVALAFALFLGLGLLGASRGGEAPSLLLLGLSLPLTALVVGIALGASVRRLHDLGQPGWYVLVSLLPCLGFLFLVYLLVAPGSVPSAPASSSKALPALLIALVVGVVAIPVLGIVAAIAIPSLLRARVSANEAAAIGDIRSVIAAQAAYQSMNGGFYEGRLECLAKPDDCLSNSTAPPFLDRATLGPTKSGYLRELVAGPAGRDLPPGLSRSSVTSYAFVLRPVTTGQSGVRSFCGDSSGRVCFDPGGRANLVDKTTEDVVCSADCLDLR